MSFPPNCPAYRYTVAVLHSPTGSLSPHQSDTPRSLHPQPHKRTREPLRARVRLLPRHLDHAQQLLDADARTRRLRLVVRLREPDLPEHADRATPLLVGPEELHLPQHDVERTEGRERRDAQLGVEDLVEPEVGQDGAEGRGRDDEQTAALWCLRGGK